MLWSLVANHDLWGVLWEPQCTASESEAQVTARDLQSVSEVRTVLGDWARNLQGLRWLWWARVERNRRGRGWRRESWRTRCGEDLTHFVSEVFCEGRKLEFPPLISS